jgi:hypothetical protein
MRSLSKEEESRMMGWILLQARGEVKVHQSESSFCIEHNSAEKPMKYVSTEVQL